MRKYEELPEGAIDLETSKQVFAEVVKKLGIQRVQPPAYDPNDPGADEPDDEA